MDKGFILGRGSYTVVGVAGEVEVPKGELEDQRKVTKHPGKLCCRWTTQARIWGCGNPAAE